MIHLIINFCVYDLIGVGSVVSFWVREKIRIIELKFRALSQYGGGMGGVFRYKKNIRQTPLLIFAYVISSSFFKKNIVKYCKIQYIYIKTV